MDLSGFCIRFYIVIMGHRISNSIFLSDLVDDKSMGRKSQINRSGSSVSFDDVSNYMVQQNSIQGNSLNSQVSKALNKRKLAKLKYYFSSLKLNEESCRQRILCEVARSPQTYSPLSGMLRQETR